MYQLVIVEDDYQIRNGLSRFFPWQQLGFQMAGSFENGKDALEFLRQNRIDVVLTDIRMPVMDGLTLAETLKREDICVTIVVISAYRDFDYARRAVNLGIRHYMVKSAQYDELSQVFKEICAELDAHVRGSDKQSEAELDELTCESGDHVIRRINEYILEHLDTVSLRSTAAHVGLSPVYLSRYFKEKTDVNFIDYLTAMRMKRAAELLSDPRMRIAQISDRVGYSNEKNFSRAFKRYYGVSPNDYRKLV